MHTANTHNIHTNNLYGKEMSTILSGIAILMMIMHHFFGFPNLYKDGITYISIFGNLNINGLSLEQFFAGYCKMCVSIYAFNTGYAIWVNRENYSYKSIISRIIRFIISYWVIYGLFMIYAFAVNENLPPLKNFLLNLIGMGTSHDFVNISSAWYISFYITILLIAPFLIFTFKKGWMLNCIISIGLIILTYSLHRYVIATSVYSSIFLTVCGHLSNYLSSVLAGIFVCKYRIFEKLNLIIGDGVVLSILLIVLTIIIRPLFPNVIGLNKDAILVVALIYGITNIITRLKSNKIKTTLHFLGIYSLNMWFVQPIFYTGKYDLLQRILFYPKYSIFIYIWCVILILILSIVCTYIQKKVLKISNKLITLSK